MTTHKQRLLKLTSLSLILVPYMLYLGLIIRTDRGPVDYETFISIGHRLLHGGEIYGVNSYYPMPFVMIFAFFAWLPRALSMAIWFLFPVFTALLIANGNPFILLFAPTFAHFVGGQTAIFGLLGLWGYRKYINTNQYSGGIFLALTMLKPQLGIVPLVFAIIKWCKEFPSGNRISKQAWAFIITMIVFYLPGFILVPDWPIQWLGTPRPLFVRAMSGFLPRTLLHYIPYQTSIYWIILIVVGIFLLWGIWLLNRKTLNLDLVVVWGFIVSPLVHDYDLLQLIAVLERPKVQFIAILLSLPGWLVIALAYTNDSAWYVFTMIAPGLLCTLIYLNQKTRTQHGDNQKASASLS